MVIKLDKLGRIVIPKTIRHSLGIQTGDSLDITEQDGTITIKAKDSESPIENRNGILVYTAKYIGTEKSIEEFIKSQRDDRTDKFT